jgi:phosphoribosylaminoimidazole carboxylase
MDTESIKELSKETDLITTEIEHVDTESLLELERSDFIVRPNANTIAIIQDKFKQRTFLESKNIAQPEFVEVLNIEMARDAGVQLGYPFMLKCKCLAYDGKGNAVVNSSSELDEVFDSLNGGLDLYAEQMVPFIKELAVMVVRTVNAGLLAYPVVETMQVKNVCHLVVAPAQVSKEVYAAALALAVDAVTCFDGVGIYGVELFLLPDDMILLNEIAPR